jgi:mycothiol synthase
LTAAEWSQTAAGAVLLRPYVAQDAPLLARLQSRVEPRQRPSANAFRQRLAALLARGGCAWVAGEAERPLGYAALDPAPGLPGVADLDGFVAPPLRRRGLGSRLWQRLRQDAAERGFHQVVCPVTSLDTVAARFLRRHGFAVHHEEWRLVCAGLSDLPPLRLPPGCNVQSYPAAVADDHFRRLYRASFARHPWHQPYDREEVAAELTAVEGEILFLVGHGQPVGFVWPRLLGPGSGVIEPVGVAVEHQGRGYGRCLMLAALYWLAERGARQVSIGAWRQNEAALHLYHSLGFRHQESVIYLAADINSR